MPQNVFLVISSYFVMKEHRLRCFGHIGHKDDADCLNVMNGNTADFVILHFCQIFKKELCITFRQHDMY